ncbi:MAG TPA: N-acetylglucosamine-6-phosphate deacetylase [Pyrinomonadaceae bacterium]|jgi:N-acetylglucosamine-6-phosphate deacetylase|nr:N-acetylglucosamine-6-phosphate deacetylase [Pyrinomonadaceae bacterium]
MTLTSGGRNIHLRNARIVLRERVLQRTSLLLQDGRIAKVFEMTPQLGTNEFEIDIDASGLTLFPGFIDVHIHGAVGVDTMAATGADLDRVSQFLATRGVTGWLPTLVPASQEEYAQAIKAIDDASSSSKGARILGVHYEGPFVNSAQCGALHEQFFRSYTTPDDLDCLPTVAAAGAKHMITLAPEIDGGLELVRELNRRNWIVSVGHTHATFDLLEQVAAAGARHLTHFMNAMPPLHHRAPGPIGWALSRDDVTCDFIADGIHLDPQMLRLLLKLKGADRLSLISDAIAAAGMGDGNYKIWGETISVKNGCTSNRGGTIAGSVITMHDAARMMLSLGASEIEIAKMAATNPARLLGIDQDCGSIEAGKRADLVAVDAEGNVALTIIGGQVVFEARKK